MGGEEREGRGKEEGWTTFVCLNECLQLSYNHRDESGGQINHSGGSRWAMQEVLEH